MADDIDQVIKWAESQGWDVRVNAQGYRYFYPPGETSFVARYPATPSNPRRRLDEVLVRLRAHGLEWPAPSKKEQKARRRKEGK